MPSTSVQTDDTTHPTTVRTSISASAEQGIYLVTRLDAYTTQGVLELIDRSGPATPVASGSRYVFDQDPTWNSAAAYLNDYMTIARNLLTGLGKTVELNADSVYVTSRQDVIGYVSWGSNDHNADSYSTHAVPLNSWVPGAIVETYVSTSARSFEHPPAYGQSLIADLIEEGVSGAKGYVYEPYSTSMAKPFRVVRPVCNGLQSGRELLHGLTVYLLDGCRYRRSQDFHTRSCRQNFLYK